MCEPRLSAFSVSKPEEALHQVQPRGVRRREVEVDARMAEQPPMHRRGFVRGEVVQHDVDVQRGLDARVDLAQEGDEILGAMPSLAPREDFARRDVQRGEEIERAMAEVVVGPPFGLAEVHRQDRLRALQRLDLRLLVDGEHHRIVAAGSCTARRRPAPCRRVAGPATA